MNTLNYTNEQISVSLGCTVTLYFLFIFFASKAPYSLHCS